MHTGKRYYEIKLRRAYGGYLGIWGRRRTCKAARSHEELLRSVETWISEWGNPAVERAVILRPINNLKRGTGGSETSKYPEEKKSKEIP